MTFSFARAALTAPFLLLAAAACSANIIPAGPTSSSTGGTTVPVTTAAGTGGATSSNAGNGVSVAVGVGTGGGVPVDATSVSVGGAGGAGTTFASAGPGGAPSCTPPEEAMVWAEMVQAPIKPGQAALLDLAGPKMMGLTLPETQQILCTGTDEGDAFGDGSDVWAFGDNMDVTVDYAAGTKIAAFLNVWGPGYVGALKMISRDGVHLYQVTVSGVQITKDGQPYQLDWNLTGGLQSPQFIAEENELHDALAATYLPGTPADPACQTSGSCMSGTFGDVGYVYFKDVGIGVWVASISAAQPVPSTPNRIDVYAL